MAGRVDRLFIDCFVLLELVEPNRSFYYVFELLLSKFVSNYNNPIKILAFYHYLFTKLIHSPLNFWQQSIFV